MWTVAMVVHCCESQLYLPTIKCAVAQIRILFIFHHVTPRCLDPVMCIRFSLCLCYELLVVISATRLHYRPGKQVGGGIINIFVCILLFLFFEKLSLYKSLLIADDMDLEEMFKNWIILCEQSVIFSVTLLLILFFFFWCNQFYIILRNE